MKMLVTVKAYPNPSRTWGDAACIAGMSEEKRLVRLYPVPYRALEDERQFQTYQMIRVPVFKARTDPRPETFRPQIERLEVMGKPLGTEDGWWARRQWVMPAASPSLCHIQAAQARDRTSLGVFKPREVLDFDWEEESSLDWTDDDLKKLKRRDLFLTKERKLLEKIPYAFRYRFRCADCVTREPHHMKIVDWQLMQLFRKLRLGHEIETCLRKLREKWLDELCGPGKDTYFFVGNTLANPTGFLVLGVFWPPKEVSKRLL